MPTTKTKTCFLLFVWIALATLTTATASDDQSITPDGPAVILEHETSSAPTAPERTPPVAAEPTANPKPETPSAANVAESVKPVAVGPTAGIERDWSELPTDEQELEVWDPLEPFNRGMFWFNDKLYFYVLKPVAKGYRAVAPEPVRESVGNFFRNLMAPVRIVNSLLQFKVIKTLDELTMFCANSTLGIAGLFDLRSDDVPQPSPEDFGQTLGHYGSPPGFYLVLPVFGSTNARDAVGLVGDILVAPVSSPYYVKLQIGETAGLQTFDTVNGLSLDKDTYEAIKSDSIDPYLFMRNAYMQQRQSKVDK